MKKVLFLVALFSFATIANMSAQSTPAITSNVTAITAAVEAAKNDPSIIQKEGKDGLVTFSKKSVCSKSGKVSYKAVSYNAETKSWDAAKSCSSKAKATKSCCSSKKGKAAKSCSGKKAKSCSGKKAKSCHSKAKKKA